MQEGYLNIVLHAHLPFVRHPDREDYLEERWLFEAITDTYLPLLQIFNGLVEDGVEYKITMSFSPTLLAMLSDPLLQDRYRGYLAERIDLAQAEMQRTKTNQPEFYRLAQDYAARFTELQFLYEQYRGNLIGAYRELSDGGYVELMTCAATHPFLPFVSHKEMINAQIATAVKEHIRHFQTAPRGIWLPECGYAPGLEELLAKHNLSYFFVDAHGLLTAEPKPVLDTCSPVLTENGVAAFARDTDSSKQVWSSEEGYPGDYDYREYYRDIGFDLDDETLGRYLHPSGIRLNTGLKYFRITGKTDDKQPYNPDNAREKAAAHAEHFLSMQQQKVTESRSRIGRRPIITAPYDAELFGHWWHEGPVFLDILFRKMHFDQDTVSSITPSEYLETYQDFQVCRLPMSSWGRNGCGEVWVGEDNNWIYPGLHQAEAKMVELADRTEPVDVLLLRAVRQAARELMLAQSSDFAFIMDNKTTVDYAVRRTKHHLNRFSQLYRMIRADEVDEHWLALIESMDNLFPEIDITDFQSDYSGPSYTAAVGLRVLVLSWEFPPFTVGGLSRHVYDLTRALARLGVEVHVLTVHSEGAPFREVVEGVHIHRVHVMKPDADEFIHWAFQMNLTMIDACEQLVQEGLTFHLVHAHDWLVKDAAEAIKHRCAVPLVATIHATEYGRNNGIWNDLQRKIHSQEWKLTYEASDVVVCSTSMLHEVEQIFELPTGKTHVIPNGIDEHNLSTENPDSFVKNSYALQNEKIVLFLGRLVREKGVHTLLEAVPAILSQHPDTKFVIVGRGPFEETLRQQTQQSGLVNKVLFTGFVSDYTRNLLLSIADVAVFPSLYEPFGIAALEAMATGTPVVASDVGGLADVVRHGHNGLKMYPGDAASLAMQVAHLLTHDEEARRFTQTAKAELHRFDWEHIANETIEVYKRAINKIEKTPSLVMNFV